jgi:hypothetical protein
MEAMACGTVPVTTNFWAQGAHALAAPLSYVSDGLPQKSELSKCLWLSNLYAALEKSALGEFEPYRTKAEMDIGASWGARNELMAWARARYDWERVIDQWEVWIKQDNTKPKRKRKK